MLADMASRRRIGSRSPVGLEALAGIEVYGRQVVVPHVQQQTPGANDPGPGGDRVDEGFPNPQPPYRRSDPHGGQPGRVVQQVIALAPHYAHVLFFRNRCEGGDLLELRRPALRGPSSGLVIGAAKGVRRIGQGPQQERAKAGSLVEGQAFNGNGPLARFHSWGPSKRLSKAQDITVQVPELECAQTVAGISQGLMEIQ